MDAYPRIIKCALTLADIKQYNLPTDFTKATDTRSAKFVEKFGDVAVELDALPVEVLRERIVSEIESRLDLPALRRVQRRETKERRQLVAALSQL